MKPNLKFTNCGLSYQQVIKGIVEFDPAVLVCTRVSSGGFLGSADSTIFFSKVDSLKGYVAVGYILIQGSTSGVSGSGALAQIYFKFSEEVGDSTLVNLIFNYQTLTFSDSNGEREDWKESVYIHNTQVLIRNSIENE